MNFIDAFNRAVQSNPVLSSVFRPISRVFQPAPVRQPTQSRPTTTITRPSSPSPPRSVRVVKSVSEVVKVSSTPKSPYYHITYYNPKTGKVSTLVVGKTEESAIRNVEELEGKGMKIINVAKGTSGVVYYHTPSRGRTIIQVTKSIFKDLEGKKVIELRSQPIQEPETIKKPKIIQVKNKTSEVSEIQRPTILKPEFDFFKDVLGLKLEHPRSPQPKPKDVTTPTTVNRQKVRVFGDELKKASERFWESMSKTSERYWKEGKYFESFAVTTAKYTVGGLAFLGSEIVKFGEGAIKGIGSFIMGKPEEGKRYMAKSGEAVVETVQGVTYPLSPLYSEEARREHIQRFQRNPLDVVFEYATIILPGGIGLSKLRRFKSQNKQQVVKTNQKTFERVDVSKEWKDVVSRVNRKGGEKKYPAIIDVFFEKGSSSYKLFPTGEGFIPARLKESYKVSIFSEVRGKRGFYEGEAVVPGFERTVKFRITPISSKDVRNVLKGNEIKAVPSGSYVKVPSERVPELIEKIKPKKIISGTKVVGKKEFVLNMEKGNKIKIRIPLKSGTKKILEGLNTFFKNRRGYGPNLLLLEKPRLKGEKLGFGGRDFRFGFEDMFGKRREKTVVSNVKEEFNIGETFRFGIAFLPKQSYSYEERPLQDVFFSQIEQQKQRQDQSEKTIQSQVEELVQGQKRGQTPEQTPNVIPQLDFLTPIVATTGLTPFLREGGRPRRLGKRFKLALGSGFSSFGFPKPKKRARQKTKYTPSIIGGVMNVKVPFMKALRLSKKGLMGFEIRGFIGGR